MFILFMAYALVVLWGMKINLKDKEYFSDYISKDKSTSIKGIFILLVFFSHFNKYTSYSGTLDTIYFKIVGLVGQIMVVPFLFYSGYGVMESIKKKGDDYISSIPKNRVLRVFLEFFIATVFVLIVKFVIGESLGIGKIVSTLLCWDRDWFILAIIFLYIFTYLSFKMLRGKAYISNIILVFLLTIVYIVIISRFRNSYWYDTVLCYPVGMIYSLYKEKIEKLTAERLYKWIISIIIIGILASALKIFGGVSIIPVILGFMLASMLIVILTMRVSPHNRIINWFGAHLFEIYLLHHIPMMILDKLGFIKFSAPISFIISVMVTMALAFGFSKLYKKIWGLIKG